MEKLDQLELQYKQMIRAKQDYVIILIDKDETIFSCNIGTEMIKGYKPDEIIG